MIIGILKEIKKDENRVAITPAGAEIMKQNGHSVLVQTGAGTSSGFDDAAFTRAGAEILDTPAAIFSRAEMILRVREPHPGEFGHLRAGQIYFSYLHLAASEPVTRALIDSGVIAIAYETVQKTDGSLPLLAPMSEVAGPMAIQEGAKYLEMAQGGHGVLLGGVPGVDPASVLILGGGKVGINAARVACGLGAKVHVLDMNLERLRYLSDVMPPNCFLQMASPAAIRELIKNADIVVGAALIPGSRTPTLISRDMLHTMKRGAVLIDVAIDQGGCFETSRETTHADPTYILDGIVHYAVGNMAGALPRTSTIALTNATLMYALEIANKGWREAMKTNPELRRGANVVNGTVTFQAVAETFGLEFTPIDELL